LELVDRIATSSDPIDQLQNLTPLVGRPANRVRSVTRLFCSEVEDKGWFHSEEFWRAYLTQLAAHRFNRFSLTLGLGYNFPYRVTDAYLFFAYPFLVAVPGYDVRVPELPDEERERNLDALRFISEEAVRRGLDFQLGLWTHAYEWIDSPEPRHTIEGLSADEHAAYCRDALQTLLQACPAVGGVTLRIHGESGIHERSWDFWATVFDGLVRADRPVGLDLHAKGLDHETLNRALATGLPVTISPKFWAEHMGLPYHQAAIREMERPPDEPPPEETPRQRFNAVSEGSRPFTRYGYGDFLREDRTYDVVFRLWAGTQRLLLWSDPAMAAGYGRAASLVGGGGIEWMEPLTFKGREGSGGRGPRTGYADASLEPDMDWQKYADAYRLMGRLTYDPDSDPDGWRRDLRTRYGSAAAAAEGALSNASRILPLVTTAHHPSASNNYFWPEIYTDMPIVEAETGPRLYYDAPMPYRFGTVSALDPEMFSSSAEFVDEAISGAPRGRFSPLDVARSLQRFADQAEDDVRGMEATLGLDPDARRLVIDVQIQVELGRFFAAKLRAAVSYEAFLRTGRRSHLKRSCVECRAARDAWAAAAARADPIYVADLSFGPQAWLRGHWTDRLAAIDANLDDLEAVTASESDEGSDGLWETLERRPPRSSATHAPPGSFRSGEDLRIELSLDRGSSDPVVGARLRYRHMDQSERYVDVEMDRDGGRFAALIPASYTDSAYPLAYFFVLRDGRGAAWMYPGFEDDLSNQPYFTARTTAFTD
jgi:hypothetical protein